MKRIIGNIDGGITHSDSSSQAVKGGSGSRRFQGGVMGNDIEILTREIIIDDLCALRISHQDNRCIMTICLSPKGFHESSHTEDSCSFGIDIVGQSGWVDDIIGIGGGIESEHAVFDETNDAVAERFGGCASDDDVCSSGAGTGRGGSVADGGVVEKGLCVGEECEAGAGEEDVDGRHGGRVY